MIQAGHNMVEGESGFKSYGVLRVVIFAMNHQSL